jgi:hypothetical protein
MKLLFIILLIIVIIVLYNTNKKESFAVENKDEIIKTLIRQASRYGAAAEQDNSPMIAVLHANYAVGYADALLDIATSEEISKYVNPKEWKNKLLKIQDNSVKKVTSICPQYASGIDAELSALGSSR